MQRKIYSVSFFSFVLGDYVDDGFKSEQTNENSYAINDMKKAKGDIKTRMFLKSRLVKYCELQYVAFFK